MVNWSWKEKFLVTISAALGCTGAAFIYFNSSLATRKRTPFSLKHLEGALLRRLDGSGQVIPASDLWRDKGAVIMVVRRPGCPLCRAMADDLSSPSVRTELDQRDVPLYGILHEQRGADWFKAYLKDGELLLDEEKVFYNTKAGLSDMFRLSVLKKINEAKRRNIIGNTEGDGTLLGSTLIIGPGNQGMVYQYLSKDLGDSPSIEDICTGIRMIQR